MDDTVVTTAVTSASAGTDLVTASLLASAAANDTTTTPAAATTNVTTPTQSPTIITEEDDTDAEETHERDAHVALLINVTLICCILLSYVIKTHRLYHVPESAAALLVGVVVGGLVRIFAPQNLDMLSFSPELFFFVLLPPIIFEAGYSLRRKDFFENFGAIILYAFFGTMASTFVVGYLTYWSAKLGLVRGVDSNDPMEALLFGSLISAVDPVATLSIMGSPELQCDRLLYSLVFGESVLNDAIAIVLFKTFYKYYQEPDASSSDASSPDATSADEVVPGRGAIPDALLSFASVSLLSIVVGVGLGLAASLLYRRNRGLRDHPQIETSLLFLFCYLCYSTAEAVDLSGIMALFFQGVVLAHYNSHNLSPTALTAAEQIFGTIANVSETVVFLYMGMGVFAGKFFKYHVWFSLLALVFCAMGRAINIFPLSRVANLCRGPRNVIPLRMQWVLWFAGLRGAIAYALSENMPGPNGETYVAATLSICVFTTVVCGGFTERMLSAYGMRHDDDDPDGRSPPSPARAAAMRRMGLRGHGGEDDDDDDYGGGGAYDQLLGSMMSPTTARQLDERVRVGIKGAWKKVDDLYLKPWFGGSGSSSSAAAATTPARERRGGVGHGSGSVCDDDDYAKEEEEGEGGSFEMSLREYERRLANGRGGGGGGGEHGGGIDHEISFGGGGRGGRGDGIDTPDDDGDDDDGDLDLGGGGGGGGGGRGRGRTSLFRS